MSPLLYACSVRQTLDCDQVHIGCETHTAAGLCLYPAPQLMQVTRQGTQAVRPPLGVAQLQQEGAGSKQPQKRPAALRAYQHCKLGATPCVWSSQ